MIILLTLIIVLFFSIPLGQFIGWSIGHGEYTPWKWYLLIPILGLFMYDRWLDRQPL